MLVTYPVFTKPRRKFDISSHNLGIAWDPCLLSARVGVWIDLTHMGMAFPSL